MNIEQTSIDGVLKIEYNKFYDNRGMSTKVFCKELFKNASIKLEIDDLFYSISNGNVIRGMHFQNEPFEQEKLVYIVKGKIIDVVLDLRKDSKTYKKYVEFYLDSNNKTAIFVPKGCAHGFKSLENDTIVAYAISGKYSKDNDIGVKWDSINYEWNINNPILSERDKNFITMDEYCNLNK